MASQVNAGEIRARLSLDTKDFKNKMQDARGQMQGMRGQAGATAMAMQGIATASAVVGTAVVGAIGASVKVAADFEQSMARVKAISGATEGEFAQLEDKAKELGATTAFSASQASEGMSYLAMAGFKANQIIGSMPSVLNLASASQMDLGRSADIVSNIMTGFGLTADDTGMAVDVLVQTMTTANTDLEQLGLAMKYVAPVANALGIDINDTATAIAFMSNAGIQGSNAGTALRASLLQLAKPTGQAEDAISELGLQIKNSSGEMKPLPELIGHINEKMGGLTKAQKTAYASMLVGTEASAGFIAMLEQGEDKFKSYSDTLEQSGGRAEEVARIQRDTLKGAIDELTSALEGLGIAVGTTFLPALTSMTKEFTNVVSSLNEVNPELISLGLKVVGLASGFGLALGAVSKFRDVMKVLNVVKNITPMGRLLSIATLLAPAIYGTVEAVKQSSDADATSYEKMTKKADAMSTQIDRYSELREKATLTNEEIGLFMDLQDRLATETSESGISVIKQQMEALQEKSGLSNDELSEMLGLNDDLISQNPQVIGAITDEGNALITKLDTLRGINDEQRESLKVELEQQKRRAGKEAQDNIKAYNDELSKQKEIVTELNGIVLYEAGIRDKIKKLEQEKTQAIKDGADAQSPLVMGIENRIGVLGQELEAIYQNKDATYSQLIEQNKVVDSAREELNKHNEIYNKLKAIELARVGVTSEAGREVQAIERAIEKQQELLDTKRQEFEQSGGITIEEQKQLNKIAEKLGLLQGVKNKVGEIQNEQDKVNDEIEDGTKKSRNLNEVLSEDVAKDFKFTGDPYGDAVRIHEKSKEMVRKFVNIDDNGKADDLNWSLGKTITKSVNVIQSFFGGGKRHGGGTVHELPKYHNGGNVAMDTRQSFRQVNRPKFDEVDVRLLRNEMVLTQAQQANLFSMVDTFSEITKRAMLGGTGGSQGGGDVNVTVKVDALHVREEADVKRIAQELERLAKISKRAKGGLI